MTFFPVILSAPSGAGKTTIAEKIVRERADVGYSISATTRARRDYEVNGEDYFFLSPAEFERRRQANEFAESAAVHGQWYGTLRSEVQRVLGQNQFVLMDIDVQGARAFRKVFPESVLIFILPPSFEVLLARLQSRKSESAETLHRRLRTALTELEAVEEYDYVVVNEHLEEATARVSAIIDAEGARVSRVATAGEGVGTLLKSLRRDILLQA